MNYFSPNTSTPGKQDVTFIANSKTLKRSKTIPKKQAVETPNKKRRNKEKRKSLTINPSETKKS